MRKRAWCIIALIGIMGLALVPGTQAQEYDWVTYQTIWTQYPYENTTIWVSHPLNGSLVCKDQWLGITIVPFDIDDWGLKVRVYMNGVLVYTLDQEIVYILDLYASNPINDIVNIEIFIDNNKIISLDYLAILDMPSLDRDYTDLWLQLQAEKLNASLSGEAFIDRQTSALRDINMITTTGLWAMLFAGIGFVFVIVFQIIKVFNLFTYIVWFSSGLLWVNNQMSLSNWISGFSVVTTEIAFLYYAKMISFSLIILIANFFYIFSYKISGLRLKRKTFFNIDPENRRITQYEGVIGQKHNKIFLRLQDSFSALRRVFRGHDYEIKYEGNINDDWEIVKPRIVPGNVDIRRDLRHIRIAITGLLSKLAFHTKDQVLVNEEDRPEVKDTDIDPQVGPIEDPREAPITQGPKDFNEEDLTRKEEKYYNYDIWSHSNLTATLTPSSPVNVIVGHPQPVRRYGEEKEEDLIKELRELTKEVSDPKILKQLNKKIRRLGKTLEKPVRFEVKIRLANRDIYDIIDFLNDAEIFDKYAELVIELKKRIHTLERQLETKAYSYAEGITRNWEEVYRSWEAKTREGKAQREVGK